MEEQQAHEYYQELKQAGAGAAQFKQGLGFQGPRPQQAGASPAGASAQGPAPDAATQQPAGASPAPPPSVPAHPPPPFPPGVRPLPGFRPPPGLAPPPLAMPPRMPPPMGRPPFPMPPYGPGPLGYGPPPPGVFPPSHRPPFHPQPPPQLVPRPGQPHPPAAPPQAQAAAAAAEQRKAAEAEQRKREEAEAEEKRRKAEAAAWGAYKSAEGAAYYYNTLTGESSWERPEGFEGDASKASAQPTPVSTEKVAGTDWSEVTCDDGKRYYYNNRSGETSWQVPPEVEARGRVKLDPVKAAMLERAKKMGATLAPQYEAALASGTAPDGGGDDDDVSFTEDDIGGPSGGGSHPAQAVPPPAAAGGHSAPPPRPGPAPAAQPKFDPKFGMLPAVPPPIKPRGTGYGPGGFWPKERAVAAFKELLADKGIHAFSRWEREVPKLQPDPRYKYIPASERRQAFEEFCKAAGTSRAKAAGGRAAAGGGAHGSGGSAAAGKGAQEEGGGPQPAEAGFEALLHEIQEACGGAAAVGAGGGSVNGASEGRGDAKGSGSGSGPLLRWGEWLSLEQLEPMWGSDPRWRRCRAEARQRLFDSRIEPLRAAAKKAREEGFRALLKEAGVAASSRWSRTKDAVRDDTRYAAVPREEREALFRQYTGELQAAEDADRRREEKEREAQRKLEAERRAAEQRQRQAAHADAVANYKALLTEVVRDADVSWREAQPRLSKDPQGRGPTNPALERGEAERLFRDYVQDLLDVANEAYLDLLDAVIAPLLPSKEEQDLSGLPLPLLRFKEALQLLDPDPRFHRLPADLREVRWRRYVDDIIFNRDYPKARPRTQRRPKREEAGGRGEGEPGAARGRPPREDAAAAGGMDKAYAREYLQPDQKRARRE